MNFQLFGTDVVLLNCVLNTITFITRTREVHLKRGHVLAKSHHDVWAVWWQRCNCSAALANAHWYTMSVYVSVAHHVMSSGQMPKRNQWLRANAVAALQNVMSGFGSMTEQMWIPNCVVTTSNGNCLPSIYYIYCEFICSQFKAPLQIQVYKRSEDGKIHVRRRTSYKITFLTGDKQFVWEALKNHWKYNTEALQWLWALLIYLSLNHGIMVHCQSHELV